MNDRPVQHPYRQPQDPPEPPGDPMRVVLFIAGGVAVLIAAAAIFAGVSERLGKHEQSVAMSKAPPEDSVVGERAWPPKSVIPPPAPPKPPPPRTFPDGPLSFVASAGHCFGDCVATTTRIAADGHVTITMDPRSGPKCMDATDGKVSSADVAALGEEARALHMDKMRSNYVYMTDVQRLTTEVDGPSGQSIDVTHLGWNESDAGDEVAILAFHRHIEQLAGTDAWLKTCTRTEERYPRHKPHR